MRKSPRTRKAAAAVYVGSISVTSLLFGWGLNRLAGVLPDEFAEVAVGAGHMPHWLLYGSAAILLALMGNLVVRRVRRTSGSCCAED